MLFWIIIAEFQCTVQNNNNVEVIDYVDVLAITQHVGLFNHITIEDHIHYVFDLGSTLPQCRPLHTLTHTDN